MLEFPKPPSQQAPKTKKLTTLITYITIVLNLYFNAPKTEDIRTKFIFQENNEHQIIPKKEEEKKQKKSCNQPDPTLA